MFHRIARRAAALATAGTFSIAVSASCDSPPFKPHKYEDTAHTWDELMNLLLPKEDFKPHIGKWRTSCVYRGMVDADWDPLTSLQRLNHCGEREQMIESAALRSFRNRAANALPESASVLEWLSLAQHHGAPTRLLDFSQSPLVALYFATDDSSQDHRDGVIWCVYPRNCFTASNCFQEYNLWREATGEEWWFVARFDQIKKFVHHMCSISDDKHTNQLGQLQCLNDSLLFIETADTHPRVKAQQHVFAVATKPNRKIGDFLREKQIEMDKKGYEHLSNDKFIRNAKRNNSIYDTEKIYRRIIIPAEKKKEFRGKLRLLGVNASTIMPDHDGLGKWLMEYYKCESIGTDNDGNSS